MICASLSPGNKIEEVVLKQATKIEDVFLNRVCILGSFCPKQGQGFKPSAALTHTQTLVEYPPGSRSSLENHTRFQTN